MLDKLKYWIIGSPLPTQRLAAERLNKVRALAAFSPDALSSIAYANQEIYLGLAIAGSAGLALAWPIGLIIVGLLILVALSYFQTIHGYPSGGGSYVVARTNLGTLPGLIAAAALLIGYLLTAAVSLTAGVEQIASAFPVLWPYRIPLALACLGLIAWINLRGVQESGTLMAVPVYLFLVSYFGMLAWGLVRALIDGPGSFVAAPPPTQPLTLLLLLDAFSAGCTALTGIEAISNGVPSFRPPESKNAGRTLMAMALLMGLLFVGSIGLTQFFAITAGAEETILSALARRLLGPGPLYVLVQVSTMAILVVAANTSFAGFPRLAAILAQDRFLPFQLANLGDRLVFQNGILLLTAATAVLIVLFGGQSHALIPLFAVGVFLAFTLSQAGMVVHWRRARGRGWWLKAVINGVGALATALVVLVVGSSKFIEGAWLTLLFIPALMFLFFQVRAHYQTIRGQLSMHNLSHLEQSAGQPRVVVPISGVHLGIVNAINFACAISDEVTALYIELAPGAGEHVREEWQQRWPDVPLAIVPSPYRSIVGPLLDFLDETDRRHDDGRPTAVVLPEFIPAKWWQGLLHNQTAWAIKAALLYRRRRQGFQRVIIDVPYHLRK
ncbi:MAG: APC family permease [Anaerolineae bacterium]|nr:APC family permease [Anaerolineae bacterium]